MQMTVVISNVPIGTDSEILLAAIKSYQQAARQTVIIQHEAEMSHRAMVFIARQIVPELEDWEFSIRDDGTLIPLYRKDGGEK